MCFLAQGYVDVLLSDVVAQRRLRGEWPLSEVPQARMNSKPPSTTPLAVEFIHKTSVNLVHQKEEMYLLKLPFYSATGPWL